MKVTGMTLTQLQYVITIAQESSINKAAKKLFLSQPSLSAAVKDLEAELGINLFIRTNRGISITPDGKEFIGYARQVLEQYAFIQNRYINKKKIKKKFSVSTQHYTFAVKAFVTLIRQFGTDEYEFALHETKTFDVIENVRTFRSEIGILALNRENRSILSQMFLEKGLTYHEILSCGIYVYLWKGHPLAHQKEITMEQLEDYTYLIFEQGNHNSFHFAEEVLSTYDYKRFIRVDDRATMLNLMIGLNGYTLCSGIMCEELNGSDYCVVRLRSDEIMNIGYITHNGLEMSELGQQYVLELMKYQNSARK